MHYVSTRGAAAASGFAEVMLAGLARDGGLYVPDIASGHWPRLEPKAIAGFAGRPYAEVAVEVIRPFVGDAAERPPISRAWRARPMARSAILRSRRSAQLGANTFALELFHGPTLAFKDLAMQLLSRLMDHSLAARGERRTIVVATSGDTGGAAVEAFRDRHQVDLVVLFPQGRVSDVQRRMMTTTDAGNVSALAIEGTFDDCQAIVKGLFNHHAFSDRVRLSGVNSINWARIVAQVVYYFTAAVALGAPARKVAFTVPTGNFGDIYAGYVAQRMGLPIDRLVIATNVNDILARTLSTGSYELRDVIATTSPSMDIQVSSNFERLAVRRLWPRRGRGAGDDGIADAVAPLHAVGAGARLYPRPVRRRPRRRGRGRRDHAHGQARDRQFRRSAHGGRHRGRREGTARSRGADGGAVDGARGEVPRCGRGGYRAAAGFARLAIRHQSASGARHRAAG